MEHITRNLQIFNAMEQIIIKERFSSKDIIMHLGRPDFVPSKSKTLTNKLIQN